MIRVIVASNESGEQEEVYFTDDMDTKAEDFVSLDVVEIDKTIESLPFGFPLNYILTRER